MGGRREVADFWDDVLRTWTPTRDHVVPDLLEWFKGYRGSGLGAVDLKTYPDPFVGDLRGGTHEPRLVTLGLNPGTGYPALQGPGGTWTRRIADASYSRCFERSPAEDPTSWLRLHGKPSTFWQNLIRFGRRWLADDTVDVHDLLCLEMYPWHSAKLTGPISPDPSIIEKYVWEPLQEIDTEVVFAFGAPWFKVCDALRLPRTAAWGPGADPFPMDDDRGWRLSLYRLPTGQAVVVSSQPGFAGPPGSAKLEIMRELVTTHLARAGGASPRSTASAAQDDDQVVRRMKTVLEMVGVLHRRGYQPRSPRDERLRVLLALLDHCV